MLESRRKGRVVEAARRVELGKIFDECRRGCRRGIRLSCVRVGRRRRQRDGHRLGRVLLFGRQSQLGRDLPLDGLFWRRRCRRALPRARRARGGGGRRLPARRKTRRRGLDGRKGRLVALGGLRAPLSRRAVSVELPALVRKLDRRLRLQVIRKVNDSNLRFGAPYEGDNGSTAHENELETDCPLVGTMLGLQVLDDPLH